VTVTVPSRAEDLRPSARIAPSVRERLLAAAKDLFAAEGYESTTTAAIARRAGTSESQLIKHFGSKEGLLEGILDLAWTRLDQGMRQTLQDTGSALERLLALWELVMAALERDRKLRTLILLESRRARRRTQGIVLAGGYRRFVGLLDAALLEMQSAGQLKGGVPVDAVRSAWLGATEGLLRDQLLSDFTELPASFTRVEMHLACRQVLGGFLSPAGRRLLAKA
jgi:AcrR family transcriptional regulator